MLPSYFCTVFSHMCVCKYVFTKVATTMTSYWSAFFGLLCAWTFLHHRQLNALTDRVDARETALANLTSTVMKSIDGYHDVLQSLGRNMENMQTVATENFRQIEHFTEELSKIHLRMAAYENSIE